MQGSYEKIGRFLTVCNEMVEGKHTEAEARVSVLLKLVAESEELTHLFSAVTERFDFLEAKKNYLQYPAFAGASHGVIYLPSERSELLAFIFCILVETDATRGSLQEFYLRYFYEDGSHVASYALFADRMMRPFRDIVSGCFPQVSISERGNAQPSAVQSLQERTVRRNYIYRGKILNLRCDDAELPDGRACKREIIEHSGGAGVLCVQEGKVVLVKQYRYAYGEEVYEIPAGKLNDGEDPAVTAARELQEETGLSATVKHLYTLYPTPGYTDEKIYLYLAENARAGAQNLDEGEFLNVVFVPLEEAYAMVERGEIRDAKTVVALLWYQLRK